MKSVCSLWPNLLTASGQFHSLAPMYYRGSAAAVIVYDITKQVRVSFSSRCYMWGLSQRHQSSLARCESCQSQARIAKAVSAVLPPLHHRAALNYFLNYENNNVHFKTGPPFLDLFILLFVCEYFACINICALRVCLVPTEIRRGH